MRDEQANDDELGVIHHAKISCGSSEEVAQEEKKPKKRLSVRNAKRKSTCELFVTHFRNYSG